MRNTAAKKRGRKILGILLGGELLLSAAAIPAEEQQAQAAAYMLDWLARLE